PRPRVLSVSNSGRVPLGDDSVVPRVPPGRRVPHGGAGRGPGSSRTIPLLPLLPLPNLLLVPSPLHPQEGASSSTHPSPHPRVLSVYYSVSQCLRGSINPSPRFNPSGLARGSPRTPPGAAPR